MPYNRNIYDFNAKKWAIWLVPTRWRKPKLLAWIMSVSALTNDLYNRFAAYRKKVKYHLLITPQVCYIEKALNDKYDFTERRIRIIDGLEYPPVYIYRRAENKPVWIYRHSENKPLWLRRKSESAQAGVDFYVKVPIGLVFNVEEMKMLVNTYKLPTKTYAIVT